MTLPHKCCRPFAHSHIFACAGNGSMPLFDAIRQSRTASIRARWRACSVHALFRPEGPRREWVGLWRLLCGCRRWVDVRRSVKFWCFWPSRTGGLAKVLWAASRLLASDPANQVQCLGVDRFSTLAAMAIAAFGTALIVEVAPILRDFRGGAGICVLALWVFANQIGIRAA
jgi:hypothetical protein